ncbi:MAG: hypothetical protein PWP15_1142 [Methanothermococcus sp.]|uniref:hypothetical protein n=1 Tax=Methanothermococcus sp. TaxID=2614238 RepID=UPI0025906C2B|nr:hypothetical protein [Methanothermococcus sp.]MDK2790635.1 hypothetical protein [Methanothermococcus sp.]
MISKIQTFCNVCGVSIEQLAPQFKEEQEKLEELEEFGLIEFFLEKDKILYSLGFPPAYVKERHYTSDILLANQYFWGEIDLRRVK